MDLFSFITPIETDMYLITEGHADTKVKFKVIHIYTIRTAFLPTNVKVACTSMNSTVCHTAKVKVKVDMQVSKHTIDFP